MNRLWVVLGALVAAWIGVTAPLEAYGRLPGVEAIDLSPSGARFATVAELGGARRLLVIEDGKVLASVGAGETRVRGVEWAGENLVLVTTSKAYELGAYYGGKYEISQVFVLDIAKKTLLPIFRRGRLANGVWGFSGVAQKDGRWVGYFAALEMEKSASSTYLVSGHPDLYEVDLDDGDVRPAAPRAGDGHRRQSSVLDDISPTDQAKKADAPVLLLHGKDDTVVPIAQSRAMESALKRARKPVEFIQLDGEDHWMSGEATRTAILKASVAFVEKHNPAN